MSSLLGLTSDARSIAAYRARAAQIAKWREPYSSSTYNSLPLHLIEWQTDTSTTNTSTIPSNKGRKVSTADLERLNDFRVRIVFAPEDSPCPEWVGAMTELFQRCGIPRDFVAESVQGVSQSFGARTDGNGTSYVWFHILSKDIAVEHEKGGLRIVYQNDERNQAFSPQSLPGAQDQANFSWIKAGFVLKIEKANQPVQSSPANRPSNSTIADEKTTLFCFGAPRTLWERFQDLKSMTKCQEICRDPHILLDIALDEMYRTMDRAGWLVSEIFGKIEKRTLGIAQTPGKAGDEVNFTALHNLSKHAIYLQENCNAALSTVESLRIHHARTIGDQPDPWQTSTQQALEYRKTMFQSTQRRLSSLDKRMVNMIQLSFHLVTQADSKLMQSESKSMKTIAVMTLIFMPVGTVAAIFGTQLINMREDEAHRIQVSQDFWLLWLISIPLTAVVYVIWRVWYRDAKAQLRNEDPPRLEGEHGYLGWKALKEHIKAWQRRKGSKDIE